MRRSCHESAVFITASFEGVYNNGRTRPSQHGDAISGNTTPKYGRCVIIVRINRDTIAVLLRTLTVRRATVSYELIKYFNLARHSVDCLVIGFRSGIGGLWIENRRSSVGSRGGLFGAR